MKGLMKFALVMTIAAAGFSIFARARDAKTEVLINEPVAPVSGDAAGIYAAKCAKCHARNGNGKTVRGRLDHARDLTDPNWQNDVSDERLFNSISNGRNKMPAFKKSLSENQIDQLVAFVRRLKR
jgi:mono/diheme cytochrome c family protein